MENMNTNEENGSLKYSIHLIDGKVIKSELRKKTDLCPICKNGQGCEDIFAHGRLWT
jgi:hypothetical protein